MESTWEGHVGHCKEKDKVFESKKSASLLTWGDGKGEPGKGIPERLTLPHSCHAKTSSPVRINRSVLFLSVFQLLLVSYFQELYVFRKLRCVRETETASHVFS